MVSWRKWGRRPGALAHRVGRDLAARRGARGPRRPPGRPPGGRVQRRGPDGPTPSASADAARLRTPGPGAAPPTPGPPAGGTPPGGPRPRALGPPGSGAGGAGARAAVPPGAWASRPGGRWAPRGAVGAGAPGTWPWARLPAPGRERGWASCSPAPRVDRREGPPGGAPPGGAAAVQRQPVRCSA